MQMLKKLFNSDNKYFLELDEIKESQPVQTVVETAEKVADVVKDKASEIAESQPAQKAAQKAKETADKAQEKTSSAATKVKETADKAKEKSSAATKVKPEEKAESDKPKAKSSQNGKAAENSEKTTDQPASPENSGASSFDPPFWVAAMYNNNSNTEESIKAEQTFATDNLMPTVTKYRRRPGGSLKKFKEMAKQAKTPKG